MRVRLSRTIALAVIIGIGLFNLYQAVTNWTLSDAGAYWEAAMRIRDGQQLYPPLASVDASDVYRYAPWFALAAVPFTFLSVGLAGGVWSVILLAASAAALVPLVRMRAWILVIFFAPILVGISAVGNAHPLLIAGLMLGVERRSGPLWVALAASLKVFPLLFALVYAGRRQWRRFSASVAFTAVLWAPALVFDLANYAVDAGQAAALFQIPVAYLVVVGLAIGATLALAGTRWGWVTAATAVVLSLPRLFVYDVTFLMVGATAERPPGGGSCRTG